MVSVPHRGILTPVRNRVPGLRHGCGTGGTPLAAGIDRTHLADLLSLGLVDDTLRGALSGVLRERLNLIEQARGTNFD